MGAVVVQDDVHVEFGRHVGLDHIEKLAKFLRAMTAVQLADHAAGLQFQRGKQGSRPMAFVVVRAALHLPGLQRQQRLRCGPAPESGSSRPRISTSAWSGGFIYRPTMSRTFSIS